MSGVVQRCTACGAEMVIERRHAGRTVPCPRCLAANEVPKNLDFLGVDVATSRDSRASGWLIAGAIFSFVTCCLPVSAYVVWYSSGIIGRARDEGREPDPQVLSARIVAGIFAVIQSVVWLLAVAGWVFS